MSSNQKQNPHILIIPFPAQGHILPLLDLTHQLAIQNITITILTTPKNLQTLAPLINSHPTAAIHTFILPFPPHPSIPAGLENLRHIGNHGGLPTIASFSALRGPISHWFHSHPNPPSAFLFDLFLGWAAPLAASLGVAAVSFSSSNAFFASIVDDGWLRLRSPAPLPVVVSFPGIPGSPEFEYSKLSTLMRLCRESTPDTDLVTESVLAGVSSEVIMVFNTFEAMERKYLQHLRSRGGDGGGGRVFAVGPLSLVGIAAAKALPPELAAWLDGCEEGSVLYVCFGSQKVLSEEQMEALALGLERSRVRFIWVVKQGNAAPDGFGERVGSRGLVIDGWAPQVEILGHRAVGGFLSHCGWNSTLEGVVAGVRILAWPMEADQFVNARLLVEDLGVAVRVCEGANAVPDADQLAKAVEEVMGGDVPVRVRAEELREEAVAAVREGGSSLKDLDEFVRVLKELPRPVVPNVESK